MVKRLRCDASRAGLAVGDRLSQPLQNPGRFPLRHGRGYSDKVRQRKDRRESAAFEDKQVVGCRNQSRGDNVKLTGRLHTGNDGCPYKGNPYPPPKNDTLDIVANRFCIPYVVVKNLKGCGKKWK